jgi:hypothetical protein
LNAIEIPGFGDVPVLAELAGQIAAGGTKRQNRRARQEMIKRFLFNWVDAKAGGAPISGEYHLVALPRAYKTKAALTFVQLAKTRADVALDSAVL